MNFLAIAALFLISLLAPDPAPGTWSGFVTDTHCGTSCQRKSAMTPDLACIRLCVKRGSKYGSGQGIMSTRSSHNRVRLNSLPRMCA